MEGGLEEVTHGTGLTRRRGVAILVSSVLEELLDAAGGNESGTLGGGDKSQTDGTALSSDLHGDGVSLTELAAPPSTTNGDDGELGAGDGTTDSGGDFSGALNSETDVSVTVTDNNESLEAGTLSSGGLLLDGHDLHDLILERVSEETVDDLGLLDGEREGVDVLERADLTSLYETSELGNGDPLGLLSTATTATATSTTTSASASTAGALGESSTT